MFLAQTRTKPVNCPTSPILHKVSIPNSVISVSSVANPHISPIRLLPSYRCLLSMSYGSLLTTSTSQTALDAPSLVFLPPAGTCSLHPSLAATQRAAVAVQIVCPDDLSLNRSPCYAFGPRIKYGAGSGTAGGTNPSGTDLDTRRVPEGGAPGMERIKNPAQSSHQLVRYAG